MPVQNVNINNVSMDYFLRGVDAAKPKSAQQAPKGAQAGANAVAAPELEAAGKMVSQLDVLLMKAAKVSTQSLDGKRVTNKLQKLVTDGALSGDSLNLLAKTAEIRPRRSSRSSTSSPANSSRRRSTRMGTSTHQLKSARRLPPPSRRSRTSPTSLRSSARTWTRCRATRTRSGNRIRGSKVWTRSSTTR